MMTPQRMHSGLSGCSNPHLGQIITALLSVPQGDVTRRRFISPSRALPSRFPDAVLRIVDRPRGSVKKGRTPRIAGIRLPGMANEPPPYPLPGGTDIGHVHLKVADLEKAIAFYCGVLGFTLTSRFGAQ